MKKLLTLLLTLVMVLCLVSLNNYHTLANDTDEEPVLLLDGINFGIKLAQELDASSVTEVHFIKTASELPEGVDVSANNDGKAIAVRTGTIINIYSNTGFKLNPNSSDMFANWNAGSPQWSSVKIVDFGVDTDLSAVTNAQHMFNMAIALTTIIAREDFPETIQNSEANSGHEMFTTYQSNIVGGNGTVCGNTWTTGVYYDGRGARIDREGTAGCLTQAIAPPKPAEPETGDMSYDTSVTVGDTPGAFVDKVEKGNASKVIHILNIDAVKDSTKIYEKKNDTWKTTELEKTLYEIVNSLGAAQKFTKLTFTKDYIKGLPVGVHQYKVDLSDGVSNTTATYYIQLTITDNPAPSPSPSEPAVKDESCEKVIGPTWHWNNTKGVCEEYATVGTATR